MYYLDVESTSQIDYLNIKSTSQIYSLDIKSTSQIYYLDIMNTSQIYYLGMKGASQVDYLLDIKSTLQLESLEGVKVIFLGLSSSAQCYCVRPSPKYQ